MGWEEGKCNLWPGLEVGEIGRVGKVLILRGCRGIDPGGIFSFTKGRQIHEAAALFLVDGVFAVREPLKANES